MAQQTSDGSSGNSNPAHQLALLAVIPVVVGLLYHRALGMWWTADDPMILWGASRFNPVDYFFNPEVWRSLNSVSLTPWLHLGFDLDLGLVGLHPFAFHLHQLIALLVSCLAFWWCLRLFLNPLASIFGALVLLLAPATAELAGNLATRHYVEGLALACLAFVGFVLSIRRSDARLVFAAAGLYLLALTAKDIYAPLPLVLAALPVGGAGERFKRLAPFAAVVVFYIAWRSWMLGVLAGGYRTGLIPSGSEIANAADSMVGELKVTSALALLGVLTALAAGAVLLVRRRSRWSWFWALFAVSTIGPVVPVIHVYSPRHSFGVAVLIAAGLAGVADQFGQGRVRSVGKLFIGAAVLTILVSAAMDASRRLPPDIEIQRVRTEGSEVLTGTDPHRLVVSPLMPYWHFFGLLRLREDLLELPLGPGVVSHTCCVPLLDIDDPTWDPAPVRFDTGNADLVAIGEEVGSCRFDRDRPLSVDIRYDSEAYLTTWQLGPSLDGRYTVLWAISANSLTGVDVPPRGEWRGNIAFEMGAPIVVMYWSPDGWMTPSPRLAPKQRTGVTETSWSR